MLEATASSRSTKRPSSSGKGALSEKNAIPTINPGKNVFAGTHLKPDVAPWAVFLALLVVHAHEHGGHRQGVRGGRRGRGVLFLHIPGFLCGFVNLLTGNERC